MALVPFDDRDGWIWWDGALVPWRDAKLHVLTHGLHYASAVFEGERAYAGNIFRLREHTERLINSARILGFEIPYTRRADRRGVQRGAGGERPDRCLCAADRLARLGDAGGGGAAHEDPSGDRRLAVAELFRRRPDGGHPHGMAEWSARRRETAPTAVEGDRPLHDRHAVEAPRRAEGYADALMLDWRGRVAETTGANIFFVMDGELHTPTPDCFLDGITRRSVMSLARRQQIKVVERAIECPRDRPGDRGVPRRHRGRGDAGARDRRAPLHAGADHRDAAARATRRWCGRRRRRWRRWWRGRARLCARLAGRIR